MSKIKPEHKAEYDTLRAARMKKSQPGGYLVAREMTDDNGNWYYLARGTMSIRRWPTREQAERWMVVCCMTKDWEVVPADQPRLSQTSHCLSVYGNDL